MLISLARFLCDRIRWRKLNRHNRTTMSSPFDIDLVVVGEKTYGPLNVYATGADSMLEIGRFCSIAPHVSFVLNNEHNVDTFSTYPFKVMLMGSKTPEAFSKGGISVGDGVWIGFGATVLDGVSIGDGAIVGAGAVVAKDIPPYAVAVGVPAKVVKYRFDEGLREKMKGVDYSRIDERFVRENIDDLYEPLNDEMLQRFMRQLEVR